MGFLMHKLDHLSSDDLMELFFSTTLGIIMPIVIQKSNLLHQSKNQIYSINLLKLIEFIEIGIYCNYFYLN